MAYQELHRPHVIFKMMERKWIEKLYSHGELRFSAPEKWVQCEKENGRGQGDKYEGVFAIDVIGEDREEEFRKRYKKNLLVTEEGGKKFYQLRKTLGWPTYCFYSLADQHFCCESEINNAGVYNFRTEITGYYFQDFARGRTAEEINLLPEDERPALLVILGYDNIRLFVNKVRKALFKKYGITNSEFLFDQVVYDYSRECDKSYTSIREYPPKELFYKGKEFEYQREGRFVINSKKYWISDCHSQYLDIEIGSMESYAKVVHEYTPEGLNFLVQAEISQIGEMKKRDGAVDWGYGGM